MSFVPDNLDSIKYAELQQLARQCGVNANMKADKLKAALIQYKRKQPSHNSDQGLLKASLSSSKSIKQSSLKSTPDKDVFTSKASLSPGNSLKRSSVTITATAQLPSPETNDNKDDFDQMDDSLSDKVEAEEPPISNGQPSKKCIDWAAIHQREFEKMDSLDVYVKKREERRRRLKTPLKCAAAFAAKIAPYVEKSLTKPAVFAPSVLSTKQMNTNFSTIFKSPSAVASKTPFKPGQLRKSIVTENSSTPAQSAVNGSLQSTSNVAVKRPVFDLQASLSRPLTWTPHRGKLKPYTVAREDARTYKPKTRDQRRDEAEAKRHAQRHSSAMHRRLAN